jgi:Pregnancy-associated plasma protein-A
VANPPKQRTCGTMPVHERLLRTQPGYIEARTESENRAFQYERRLLTAQRTGVTVIPVVVHVVWKTADQNISDAQVQSQIDVLNRDYRKANPDVASLPGVFQPLASDARIEFQLATTAPNGAATNGITRTQTAADSFTDDDKVKSTATGGANAWDSSKYLNLWVCELGNGLLGYAQFPGGPAATDGVVILNSAFGTVGTAAAFAPYNHGRTATHEVGHWLNLRHIWGDDGGGCTGDDLVGDTPNAAGPNFGKPEFPHVTCNNGPNGDLFVNYMDYTDDEAMFMFTSGQVARIQACLDGDRHSIGDTKAGPTISIADVHPTIAAADFHPTIASADVHPTIQVLDHGPTNFLLDRGIPGPTFPPPGPGPLAIPFVLATPHHSMVWTQSFPDMAQSRATALLNQIAQYEAALRQMSEAERTGSLSAIDSVAAEQMSAEYDRLLKEYRQLTGG